MRNILILIILFILYHLIRKVFFSLSSPKGREDNGEEVPMVKDPECGVFIQEDQAIIVKAGDEVHYFCSSACAERYGKNM